MKRVILLTVAVFFLATGNLLAADKVVYINMKEILQKSLAGQAATKDFQKAFQNVKTRIQEREKELQQMKESLEKQRIILTETALKEKEVEYEKQYRDYKRLVEDANADMQRMNQEITQRLVPEVLKIVNVIGKKEGYLAVLDTDSPGLAYYDTGSDISAKVIAEYDKEFKKGNK